MQWRQSRERERENKAAKGEMSFVLRLVFLQSLYSLWAMIANSVEWWRTRIFCFEI